MIHLLNLSSYDVLDETTWELKDLGLSLDEVNSMSITDINSFMFQKRKSAERKKEASENNKHNVY